MNEQKSLIYHLAEAYERHRTERRTTTPEQDMQPRQPGRLRRFLCWLTPNGGTLLLVALLVATAQVWARPLASPASAPGPSATTVNYQGRLANPGGTPVTDNNYGMTFALWDASSGGNLMWGPESHAAVPVSEGLFSVGLGSQTSGGIPTSVWNGDRYLEITVGGETLSPRELIHSVPVAGMALAVPDGAITSAKLSRHLSRVVATSEISMPNNHTWYDILSLTTDLDQETLVTIYASAGLQNNSTDTFFSASIVVDGNSIIHSDRWNKAGIGEQLMMSTAVFLGSGQHQIRLRAYSWSGNGFANGDDRTQLVVIEG